MSKVKELDAIKTLLEHCDDTSNLQKILDISDIEELTCDADVEQETRELKYPVGDTCAYRHVAGKTITEITFKVRLREK